MSFSNKWTKPQNEINNVGMKLLENIKPPSPLKPRIEEAQKRLHSQISKLENMSMKMEEKNQVIFKRVISAMQSHDSQYAKILSNELSQIRKMNKMITSAKFSFRTNTIKIEHNYRTRRCNSNIKSRNVSHKKYTRRINFNDA